ncbi:MAG TPA: hypothetical protein DHV72_15440 [Serratia grimesii]|jgi:hypothetical protein|uniref:Uncharacterized protein n=1 Tax=Serratia grimesii TaxID=82995 RepID=A0A9C7QWG2_9GAMM|nr:hypothetical protein [Serratia grimesii]KFB87503.1 hypothetical protein CR62_12225 [Serratia grimesii]HCK01390.1 hypothetical protein [Serratia grimesii]
MISIVRRKFKQDAIFITSNADSLHIVMGKAFQRERNQAQQYRVGVEELARGDTMLPTFLNSEQSSATADTRCVIRQ